jgi:hypothetical protein
MTTTKFEPGKSGNPKGRTAGKTPSTMLRKSIADDMPEIIKTLISLAKGGDVQAARVLLDKVCPSLKPQALPIFLPEKNTLAEQGNEIIRATVTGEVPPDIGAMLITALANQSRVIEIDDVLKRLEVLESKNEH